MHLLDTKFKIGASHTIGSYVLPGDIMESISTRVNQPLRLTLSPCEEIVQDIKEDKLDLGFIELPYNDNDMDNDVMCQKWMEDELVVCSKTKLPTFIGEKELNHYRVISCKKNSSQRKFVEDFLFKEGLSCYDFQTMMEVDHPTAIITNIKWSKPRVDSSTVAIVPKVCITHELESKTFYASRIHNKTLIRKFYIVYKKELLNHFSFPFLGISSSST